MPTDADMRAAFLAAIIEEPGEDAHRLIFADWLEDHGDERDQRRAEFIRAQCEIARLDGNTRDDPACYCDQLLAGSLCCSVCQSHEDRLSFLRNLASVRLAARDDSRGGWISWGQPAVSLLRLDQPFGGVLKFRRGFVAEVHCPLAAWEEHGPEIVRAQPVEVVRLVDREPDRRDNGRYGWVGSGKRVDDRKCMLPHRLLRRLPAYSNCPWVTYDTPEEASADLLVACIEMAKKG